MKKRSLNKIRQMVSIGMSCIMAGSTCNLPMMLHAEEVKTENMHPTYMITSFDELNEEFHFTLDPAANEENNKCETFFTKEQNGLTCLWGGHTVFCNPPYGREIGKWVQKAWEEHKTSGNTVVMLLPARTDTRWFHEFIYGKAEIRFVRGRLKFGNATNSAPFPSMVVVWRGD